MIRKQIAGLLAAATVIASIPMSSVSPAATVYAEEQYTVPDLNIANKSVPDSENFQFVNKMGAGFNLGNTFDAIDNAGAVEGDANMYLQTSWLSDGEAGETTHETIDAIKNAGFSTVRIPVSWHNHLDADFNINPDWMAKVSDIVDYSLSQGLYVILNIHHDNEKASGFTSPDYDPSWAAGNKDCYIYPDKEHLDSSINYVTKIWEQLGAEFKDCDDHLVFETMNEPRQVGNIHEWWYADDDCCHEALECITKINQAAVDTIRKSGGKNSDRYIMVPATSAKAEAAMQNKYFQMPKDSAKDKLILSVHAYEPFDFSMGKTSEGAPSEFTDAMKKDLDDMFDTLYVAFVQQNIPVVIGEFGATNRNNTQARTDQTAYYYAAARARGISCCLWDNSNAEGENEAYRFLDRTNKTFIYDSIAAAAKKYGAPRTDFSGVGVDGLVVNSNCTIYPDGKVMFPCEIGEKAEVYFDIDTSKSLCGGGALCFNLNVDGKGYWIGYPFRAGVEWDSAQNKDVPVPCTVDLTATSEMNATCWSENRKVTDTAELEMLSKLCQASTTAEIQLWWSLGLDWADRPDSSVTAGKSESEVSDLKAAAAKECIAVINVRPMSLPLDNNMGKGSWNSGNGGTEPGTTVTGTQNPNETTTTTKNTDIQPPEGDTLFHVWLAGSIGVDDFWGSSNAGQTNANITGNGTYTASFQVSSEADTISCLVLDSDVDIFQYASKDAADPIAESGIQIKVDSVMADGTPIAYSGPSDGAYCLGDNGSSLRMNILNTWTPTNKVSDIASKVKVGKNVTVKFTVSGLPDGTVTTTEAPATTTTENSTSETADSTTTMTVSETVSASTESSSSQTGTATTTTTTASSATSSAETPSEVSLYGDTNLDGRVDITDAVLLNKKVSGQVTLNAQADLNADCNTDGEVNGEDAIVLLKFLVQTITALPAK